MQLAGDVGLGRRIRGHVGLAAIGPHRLAQHGAGVVLAAHGIPQRAASGVSGWIASITSAFLARTASASKEIGGSIAVIDSNWNRWLGTMSRSAPVFS